MASPYPIVHRFDYPKFTAETSPSGYRIYLPPHGKPCPSVTTILATLPKPHLDEWRARVGDEEADRITKEATDIGSTMHDMLEGYMSSYLQGRPDSPPKDDTERMALRLAGEIRRYGLGEIDEIWGIEEALYCHELYAGRTDLTGVYRGKPSILDYKTSRRPKQDSWITSYKLQLAAYAVAHEEMFGNDIEQGVILMAIRPNKYASKPFQRFIVNKDELDHYKQEWLTVVEQFYAKKS